MAESVLPFQALPADHSTEEDNKYVIWYVNIIVRGVVGQYVHAISVCFSV